MLCLDEPSLSIEMRVKVVRSCESLFRNLFLPRCSPHLLYRDWADAALLNSICYMCWDIMPVNGGPVLQDRQGLQEAALRTMAHALDMDSLSCPESALHGLGHWHSGFPEQGRFLQSHGQIVPELRV